MKSLRTKSYLSINPANHVLNLTIQIKQKIYNKSRLNEIKIIKNLSKKIKNNSSVHQMVLIKIKFITLKLGSKN